MVYINIQRAFREFIYKDPIRLCLPPSSSLLYVTVTAALHNVCRSHVLFRYHDKFCFHLAEYASKRYDVKRFHYYFIKINIKQVKNV